MNRNLIFTFILLIALSVTNAIPLEKRSTDFTFGCVDGFRNPIDAINASVSPDPVISGKNVTFSVSGTLSHKINKNGRILISFFDASLVLIEGHGAQAPKTKAKRQFQANTTFKAPNDLPSQYSIQVLVANPSNPPNKEKDIIGCRIADASSF
ncbi:15004_t:CDS:1 [Dentiscutata erythropus]|uniref:15004_t:CDS:1 n=1 Tax=Dentiscutata erythropus TaxID=1348616 RepID=A0A9N9NZB1_9GLOM|nr:15004_t:CDS:1 [Dentiscutata erythropus]